jgi:TPR repeat protein
LPAGEEPGGATKYRPVSSVRTSFAIGAVAMRAFPVLMAVVALSLGAASAQTRQDLLKARALKGEVDAQVALGFAYADGEGVGKDEAEAAKWFRLAAEQGSSFAQAYLGLMYSDGTGVPESDAEAVKWFRRSAEQGYAGGQYNLGRAYSNGEGVPRDHAEAVK